MANIQPEERHLYGSWQALTGILAGDELPAKIVASTRLKIGQNNYEVDLAGNIDRGSCTIRYDTEPIRMKIEGTNGPNAGRTFFAILECLSFDRIKIAYDLSGTEYPTSFEPSSDESCYVATFKKCESD